MGRKNQKTYSEVIRLIGIGLTQCLIVILFFIITMYVPYRAILWPVVVVCPIAVLIWSIRWYTIVRKSYKDSRILALVLYMVFTYMLLVSLFGALFVASEKLEGKIIDSSNPLRNLSAPYEYLYFSVVTGSTLGYGNLYPMGTSRFFACLEVISFWILVIIGTLKLGME